MFRRVADLAGQAVPWLAPWPNGHTWSLVLTHDVETAVGVARIDALRDVEREHGFASSWNFVPLRYKVSNETLAALVDEGCEIGVHGLHHDGRDLESLRMLKMRLPAIRRYAREWGAVGFRAPATQRAWEWMPLLGFEYDSSYTDTDPYEPLPGGCCSHLPFMIGSMVELPITLPQDHTLFTILGHEDARCWIDKVDHIRRFGGMALALTHPDYVDDRRIVEGYRMLLRKTQDDPTLWQALPREVSEWWRRRADSHLMLRGDTWTISGPAAEEGRICFAQPTGSTMRVRTEHDATLS
jgi:peptidoglycan/xylan/chitin deacetylase (PgdA/CDA1 family)